jgi:hypothetical protein
MEVVSKALEQTSACLTFDGKKIKQGLTETTGDIDLLGFEEGISMRVRGRTICSKGIAKFISESLGLHCPLVAASNTMSDVFLKPVIYRTNFPPKCLILSFQNFLVWSMYRILDVFSSLDR